MKWENPGHFSFLLRLWQEQSEGKMTWRAWLENSPNGKRLGFSDIQKLLTYLARITKEDKSSKPTSLEQNQVEINSG
jgi:hypothetical protein